MSLFRAGQDGGPEYLFSRPVRPQSRHHNSAVAAKATELVVVVTLGVGRAPLVTQAQVESEALTYFPFVLAEEGRLHRFIGYGRHGAYAAVVCPAQQKGGQIVALKVGGVEHALRGNVRAKIESAAGIAGLEEVVEIDSPLAAELEVMAADDLVHQGSEHPLVVSLDGSGAAKVRDQTLVIRETDIRESLLLVPGIENEDRWPAQGERIDR